MARRVSIRHKRKEAPDWVFNWRRPGNPGLWKAFSVVLAGGLFALLLMSVRIRVSPPLAWAAPKASVIRVLDDETGRALTQRAREGGPFPSRFEPSEWEGTAALEKEALEGVGRSIPAHVPVLRDLPDDMIPPLRLAARGELTFPGRRSVVPEISAPGKLAPAPVIYPLSGIGFAEIPRELPPMEGAADAAMTAETWRFLVRIDAAGHVMDCVSLAGGDEEGRFPLDAWLRRVMFPKKPGSPPRWIAVGVGFANQPAADGTESH
jgi:hypothetical protein